MGPPFPQAPDPQWITFLPFILQNFLLNIKYVEFDFRMGCILVLFQFLWIINVQFTNFRFFNIFFYFQIQRYWLTLIQNCHFYHWNFSKTTFTYKIVDEITLTHTGWAWKVQNFIFYYFWELKNSWHTQTFKFMSCVQFSRKLIFFQQ